MLATGVLLGTFFSGLKALEQTIAKTNKTVRMENFDFIIGAYFWFRQT
jgi:hypothetical protein